MTGGETELKRMLPEVEYRMSVLSLNSGVFLISHNNVQKVIASWRSIVGTIEGDLQIHEISFGHTHYSLCSDRV